MRKQATAWDLVILIIVHNKHRRLNAKDDLRLILEGIWKWELEWEEEEEILAVVEGAEEEAAEDIHHNKFNEKDDFRAIQHNHRKNTNSQWEMPEMEEEEAEAVPDLGLNMNKLCLNNIRINFRVEADVVEPLDWGY